MFDRCVCCGTAVPEGRQVCPNCERRIPMDLVYDKENNVWKEGYKVEIFFDSEEQRDKFEQALSSGGLEPIRPRGRWKDGRCSNCGTQAEVASIGFNCTGGTKIDYKETNFCPSCGAVMKSEESNGTTIKNEPLAECKQWISVTERLPEFDTPVLIALRQQRDVFARVGWLHESGMWSVPTTKKWLVDAVTHWMPLPEPPKEVQNG